MNPVLGDVETAMGLYLPAFVRIAATMLLMPGLGETVIPSASRIGLAAAIAAALSPMLTPASTHMSGADTTMVITIISELLTGIWFGWLARLTTLVLTVTGQYIGYTIGLSNVLQADVDPTTSSDALGALFGLAAPMLYLATGLYIWPLRALSGLFVLIPIGHFIPVTDSVAVTVSAVETLLRLSLQLASPFIVFSILWNLLIGQMARLGGRMQVYFISFPGQILLGLCLVILSIGPILHAWEHYAGLSLVHLPGSG